MINIFILLIGIVGLCIILYAITRTETNFDIYKYALKSNSKIENKKGFITAYKISSLIVGFLLLILSSLTYAQVFSIKYAGLYFLLINLLKFIMRIFIQFKYSKK